MNLRQAVVFCILMQNNEGIVGKAPIYLTEKLKACKNMKIPECLLDSPNLRIFKEYTKKWKFNWDKEFDLQLPLNSVNIDEVTGEFLGKCDFCGVSIKEGYFNGICFICEKCKNKEK